jgi:hypothetical protein
MFGERAGVRIDFCKRWRWLSTRVAFQQQPASVMMRLAIWRVYCWMRLPANVELRRSGLQLWLPPEWRGVAKLLYAFRDDYEPELCFLRRYLTSGMVVADVGAC